MKSRGIILLFAVASVLAGCGGKTTTVQQGNERVEKVQTTILSRQKVARSIELSTTLEGYETMNVSPSLTGLIERIYVEVGDKVKKGDTLIRMDQNQLRTTGLMYANLQIEMGRMDSLLKSEAISRQVYDQTKLSYDQTKESLEFLETNTFVRAQFDGVISAKNYEDGELYAGQTSILGLKQLSCLKALIDVPESFFPIVKTGMKVNISSDIYPGKIFPAIVEIVYPTIDPASHTFSVKIKIPNNSEVLRPGMYVKTVLDLGEKDALVVPYQAVLRLIGSDERYVFINDNGKAKRVFVTLGERHDQLVEIISDEIKEGDELVTTGQSKLVDGIRLDIVK